MNDIRVSANGKPAAFEAVYEGSNPSACAVTTNQYSGVATVGRCVWL